MDILSRTSAARSYRSFDHVRKISGEEIMYLIDCARLTPSAGNIQPLKYRIVNGEDETEKFFPLTKWAGYLKDMKLPPEGKEPSAYIVICIDGKIAPEGEYTMADVGIAAQTVNLAAQELGLACCMIGSFDRMRACEVLGLREGLEPVLTIALGKPSETVVITKAEDGNIKYFRDDAGLHFVPKRSLDEVIIKK